MKYNKFSYDKKDIMTKAWKAARNACKKFGGKVRDYFAESLRLVWEFFREKFGNTVKVTAWFTNKKTGMGFRTGFEIAKIKRETEKAVLVYFGDYNDDDDSMWVPKSILLK